MLKMCSERFENPRRNPDVHQAEARSCLLRHLEMESTSSSSWSSMSGYGTNNGVQGVAAPFSAWPAVPPVEWTKPPRLDRRLPSCMPLNNEAAGSSTSTSFSGFHPSPLQVSYDRLRQTGLQGLYGTKNGVGVQDYRPSASGILQQNHGQLMSGGHGGLLMDGLPEIVNVGKMTPQEIIDAKALAASKSHSEAERRRRERINSHLATLRSLLPSTTKTDKASLLAEVIEHVKDLKRQAAEIAEGSTVPTEADEVTVDPESDPSCSEGKTLIRASVCCDDRPDLLSDLIKALRTLKLRTLKAEITTLGGRVKNILLVDVAPPDDNNTAPPPSLTCIHDALKAVMERPNSEDSPQGNKRQRLNPFNSLHLPDHRSI